VGEGTGRGDSSSITNIIADERTNSLIIIATERAYLRVLEMIRQLDIPLEGEGRIHVHYVQNGDAAEIAGALQELIGGVSAAPAAGGAPGGGRAGAAAAAGATPDLFEGAIRVTSYEPTNALVITSSLHDYAALRRVIDELDRRAGRCSSRPW
jgi:general secretion pathway protein D